MENQEEVTEKAVDKKQKRPVKLYAVVEFTDEDDVIAIRTIEAASSSEMKRQLSQEFGHLEHSIIGLFRGRRIETQVRSKVDFKIN